MCNLKALEALGAANITGSDATTSLDTFIDRTAAYLRRLVDGMDTTERHEFLTMVYGSDAIRPATVLMVRGAR